MTVNTKYLKLPFSFDEKKLQQDLNEINDSEWINHVNTAAYNKRWCCVPLYSVDGRTDTILAFDDDAEYLPSKILKRCSYFQEVIDSFKCEKAAVRLMSLTAGDEIKQHVDPYSGYETGVVRIHIPIQTSREVTFIIEEESIHFTQGDTWYINAECKHGVQNPTDRDRIHLMIDCRKNAWLEDVFLKAGFVPDDPPKYGDKNITDENIHMIIAELEAMGTETGKDAAENLRGIQSELSQ